jgi:multidrug efflux pump subunit AcrA (membrane-fusion protein)
MDVYNRVAKVVEPKRQRLRTAQEQLDAANAALGAKQAALRSVVERVDGLRRQLAETQAEQRRLNEQVCSQGGGCCRGCRAWPLAGATHAAPCQPVVEHGLAPLALTSSERPPKNHLRPT